MGKTPRGDARPRILASALKLFSERGFNDASTRDIALDSGISETSVYRIFGSKDKLFSTVIEEAFATPSYRPKIAEAVKIADDVEALRACARIYQQSLAGDTRLMRLVLFSALEKPEIIAELTASRAVPLYLALAERYSKGVRSRTFRDVHPVAAVRLLLAALWEHHFFYALAHAKDTPLAYPDHENKIFDLWLRGVLF